MAMKRLVCFFDGTWDTPDTANVTNVVKLQRATLKADAAGVEQLVHYEFGIATEFTGRRLSFWAGALSIGLGSRVRGAYRYLCESFAPGDEIYLFGFSRGAFEARGLAELISVVGLLRGESVDRLGLAWRHYRRYRHQPQHRKLARLREAAHFPVRIRCLGAWDTVGTLGIPLLRGHRQQGSGCLAENVDIGLHALAIDEPRGAFRPLLWTRGHDAASAQLIEQQWFPGSHVDVGGGGPSRALADAALLWMAKRVAATTGLALDGDYLKAMTAPDETGEQSVPTVGIYRASGLLPYVRLIGQDMRAVPPLRRLLLGGWRTSRLPRGEASENEHVDESARRRFGRIVPMRRGARVSSRRYRPRSLRVAFAASGRQELPSAPPAPAQRAAANPPATDPQPTAARARWSALVGWVLFEWAAQPFYTLIVTFLFGPYFVNHFVGDPVLGQSLWAYAAAAAGIIVAILSPLLGALVDVKGGPKWRMGLLVCSFAAAMATLWMATPGSGAIIIALVMAAYVVATVSAELAIVLLNSMMPTLVPPRQYGRLSGFSWGLGYLGGLVALLLVAALVAVDAGTGKTLLHLDPVLRLSGAATSERIVGPLCAAWLLAFSLPLFLLTPDTSRRRPDARIGDGLHEFLATVRALPRHGNILLFLVARMIFIDGLTSIFQFGGIYAASVFGWQAPEQSEFAIVLVCAGIIGALLGGILDDRVGSKRVIVASLLVLIVGTAGLLSVDATHILLQVPVAAKGEGSGAFSSAGERTFLLFAIAVALVAAPAQASCRSLLARLAPPDAISQFFGLFAFSGKATAFLAPVLIGLLTTLSGSQRIGLSTVLAFLAIGLVAMTFVRERAARGR
jgi:UMF1 family MFS transporter